MQMIIVQKDYFRSVDKCSYLNKVMINGTGMVMTDCDFRYCKKLYVLIK